jgi:hypothetical protein
MQNALLSVIGLCGLMAWTSKDIEEGKFDECIMFQRAPSFLLTAPICRSPREEEASAEKETKAQRASSLSSGTE